jgi:hypothetical protein
MRVATRPLDPQAVAKANATTAEAFPVKPRPGDPDYGQFRKTWMDAYADAGGGYESREPKDIVRSAEADAKGRDTVAGGAGRDVIAHCPGGASRPPPPPPADTSGCSCKVSMLNVVCSHDGRSASNGLLMVVAENVLGDKITVTPTCSGACEGKLTVRAAGKSGFPVKDSAPHTFRTSGKPPDGRDVFDLHRIPPVNTTVSAEACGRQAKSVKVQAYPSQKLAVKLDLKGLIEDYRGILAYLPINISAERKPLKPLTAPKEDNWEPKWGASIGAEAQWKEDKGSHRAFCEHALTGGLDPLIGVAASFPVPGAALPVPPRIREYIRAGIYLNVSLGISLGANCAWSYWPDTDQSDWAGLTIELKGAGSFEVAAELAAFSPDVIEGKVAGKATIDVKGAGEKGAGNAPMLVGEAAFQPLTVTVVCKMAWGLIETERSWEITSQIKTEPPLKYEFR